MNSEWKAIFAKLFLSKTILTVSLINGIAEIRFVFEDLKDEFSSV